MKARRGLDRPTASALGAPLEAKPALAGGLLSRTAMGPDGVLALLEVPAFARECALCHEGSDTPEEGRGSVS